MTGHVPANLLLTGRPGVGKSTVIQRALEGVSVRAGGFFTQELRVGGGVAVGRDRLRSPGGRRVGFGITTLDGREGVLAHVNIKGPPRVSKYGVNVDDIREVVVGALARALQDAELIVCDEMARMELLCREFAPMVRRCLDAETPVLGTIQERRDEFLDEVRARPDVRLLEVTAANRDDLADEVAAWIEAACR